MIDRHVIIFRNQDLLANLSKYSKIASLRGMLFVTFSPAQHEFLCKSAIPRRDHIPFPHTSTTFVDFVYPLLFLLTPLR